MSLDGSRFCDALCIEEENVAAFEYFAEYSSTIHDTRNVIRLSIVLWSFCLDIRSSTVRLHNKKKNKNNKNVRIITRENFNGISKEIPIKFVTEVFK